MTNYLSVDLARLRAEELRGGPNRPERRMMRELRRARTSSAGRWRRR
jgi:hypothetical protein